MSAIGFEKANKTAKTVMFSHLGATWKLSWGDSLSCYGACCYRTRTITLSRLLLAEQDVPRFISTVLHEVAHALVGPRVKPHGPKWQKVAYRLGCPPFATDEGL